MRRPGGNVIGVIVLIWLLIGVFATWQRGYLTGGGTSCATAGSIVLSVVAGPLNYVRGVNPKVTDCHLPEPSSSPPLGNVPELPNEWSSP